MAPQDFTRKLTAILSADVKGYSRLMAKDEAGTIQTLTIYKDQAEVGRMKEALRKAGLN